MNVERGTRRIIQHRHVEPRRGASVSHPDAGAAGCCADSDAVSPRQAIAAGKEAGGEVEHFVEIASFGQAVVHENGAVSSGGAGQRRGMRSHRARPGLTRWSTSKIARPGESRNLAGDGSNAVSRRLAVGARWARGAGRADDSRSGAAEREHHRRRRRHVERPRVGRSVCAGLRAHCPGC